MRSGGELGGQAERGAAALHLHALAALGLWLAAVCEQGTSKGATSAALPCVASPVPFDRRTTGASRARIWFACTPSICRRTVAEPYSSDDDEHFAKKETRRLARDTGGHCSGREREGRGRGWATALHWSRWLAGAGAGRERAGGAGEQQHCIGASGWQVQVQARVRGAPQRSACPSTKCVRRLPSSSPQPSSTPFRSWAMARRCSTPT